MSHRIGCLALAMFAISLTGSSGSVLGGDKSFFNGAIRAMLRTSSSMCSGRPWPSTACF